MSRRSRLAIPVALLVLTTLAGGAALRLRETGDSMTEKAAVFLASLSAEQKALATMKFDDPRRLDWHFIPKPERKGLQIKQMNESQRKAAHGLLQSALSEAGYKKAVQVMSLEGILRELEKSRKDGPIRDDERYYFTIFGEIGAKGRWGLSVEGHHLSLNFVVTDGKLTSSTPTFYGANPAEVKSEVAGYPKRGTRTLAAEEQLAFDLLGSLTAEQKKSCIIAEQAPADVRDAGKPHTPAEPARGLAYAEMQPAQQAALKKLVQVYAANVPEDEAARRLSAIEKAGWGPVKFAWAGATAPGVGHYYVIEGPSFCIELVNTQPDAEGNVANHIHSMWRDRSGDFGVARP